MDREIIAETLKELREIRGELESKAINAIKSLQVDIIVVEENYDLLKRELENLEDSNIILKSDLKAADEYSDTIKARLYAAEDKILSQEDQIAM